MTKIDELKALMAKASHTMPIKVPSDTDSTMWETRNFRDEAAVKALSVVAVNALPDLIAAVEALKHMVSAYEPTESARTALAKLGE